MDGMYMMLTVYHNLRGKTRVFVLSVDFESRNGIRIKLLKKMQHCDTIKSGQHQLEVARRRSAYIRMVQNGEIDFI